MKICHITNHFSPSWGGSETHIYTLVRYLIERGHDVDVIVFRLASVKKEKLYHSSLEGINVHNIFLKKLLWIKQLRDEARSIEKDGRIDVFDVHNISFMPAFIVNNDGKVLLSPHSSELTCARSFADQAFHCLVKARGDRCSQCWRQRGYLFWRWLRFCSLKRANHYMVKYQYLKNTMVRDGIEENRISIIPHWIDAERIWKKSRKKPPLDLSDGSDMVFGYLGRITESNGPFLLLKAFSKLYKKTRNVKLVFIGGAKTSKDMELLMKMKRYCQMHGLHGNVFFLGIIPYTVVHEYLSIPDIIVCCNLYMNYNWSLLESMCIKKPIIATKVLATEEILLDGFNALLAESTPESLSSKMAEILEDSELARKIAENAFLTVQQKHGLNNLSKYEDLVQQI